MRYSAIIFVFLSQLSFGQDYSVPGVGAHWTWAYFGMMGVSMPNNYAVTGDSLVNNRLYSVIGNGLFRDSLDVWYCIKFGEVEEHLFFDFTLDEGDTLYFHNPFITEDIHAEYLHVTLVDSVQLLNETWARRMTLEVPNSQGLTQPYRWVEEVGCASELFSFGRDVLWFDDGERTLICYENEIGEHVYESPVDQQESWPLPYNVVYENCDWYLDVGIDEQSTLAELKLYPNPVENTLFFNQGLSGSSIRVSDIADGRTELEIVHSGGLNEIDVQSLSAGVYILELTKDRKKWIRRFVKY